MENDDDIIITLSDGETINLTSLIDTSNDITIDLNQTYGATTTYAYDPGTVIVSGGSMDSSYTISSGIDTINIDSIFGNHVDAIRPDEVEKMCKEYPALDKVWRNFKSVYDMVKQDYEGKKRAGELDE